MKTKDKTKISTVRRRSYRKQLGIPRNLVMGFYGRLIPIGNCKAYCDLHKCYMQPKDIKERNCNKKKCNKLKQLGKYKDIERE